MYVYILLLFSFFCFFIFFSTNITAPQITHKRLVLQVYFESNTIEFSAT